MFACVVGPTDETPSPTMKLPVIVSIIGGGIPYILTRFMLLVMAFMSLRSLPPEAYQTVRWTTFIPYI